MPSAFITGITGQDGQHLAQFLHDQGYDVFGMVKGQNNPRVAQMIEEMPFLETVPGDLADLPAVSQGLNPEKGRRQRFHDPGCHLNSLALGHINYAWRTTCANG